MSEESQTNYSSELPLKIRGAKRVRELLESQADSARLSRELARLKNDVPLELTLDDLRLQAPDFLRLRTLFIELGFESKLPLVAPPEPEWRTGGSELRRWRDSRVRAGAGHRLDARIR